MSNPRFEDRDELQTLNDLRRLMISGGIVIIILIGVIMSFIFLDRHNDGERRARESQAKVDARVENCHAYNHDQTLNRSFQVNNILTLASLSNKDVEAIKASDQFDTYVQFINESYPYRQCSVPCLTALYDPKLVDCGQASSESGDP